MTDPGDVGTLPHTPAAVPPATARLIRTLALLLCLCALLLSFVGLFEWDVPLTRFIRSLNYFHIDHLANPWLARLSDIGDRLGKGESLVVVSLVVLAVGYGAKHTVWKAAGWQSLLAHGIAALISNSVKHLIGRPRPKFMHSGNFELSPAGGSGWDSFPSGHAAASFAVAAVFAARFPKARWAILFVAAGVAVSRILRGAHFLTDTVGGATLGYLAGTVVASPWREWRRSLESALFAAAPYLAAVLAFTWTIGHRPSDHWPTPLLTGAGTVVAVTGLVWHGLRVITRVSSPKWLANSLTKEGIALGLGMATGSLWVTATVGCICLAQEFRRRSLQQQPSTDVAQEPQSLIDDAAVVVLSLLALIAIVGLRGVLPMV